MTALRALLLHPRSLAGAGAAPSCWVLGAGGLVMLGWLRDPASALADGGWLAAAALAGWLIGALLAWRRPTVAGLSHTLSAIGCAAALAAGAAALGDGPQLGPASARAGVWCWVVAALVRQSEPRLGLEPLARWGAAAVASIGGGSWLFAIHYAQADGFFAHHTPVQQAHLDLAYTAGVTFVLAIPILIAMGLGQYIILRDHPDDPPIDAPL